MVTWLVAFLVATPPAGRTRPASSAAPIPLGLTGAALSSVILYTRKLAGTMGKKQNKKKVEEVLEELRAKLKWTQGELEAQRQAERQRQLQVGVEEKWQGIW